MFNKMIAQQTAKKEKLLDNFLKKHEAEYPFPEDVELICDIDYMGDGKPCHFMDIYRPRKIMKVLPSYIYGKHWKKSSFYPYINETCSDADNRIIKTKDALCFSGSGQFLLHS